ncbi:hypothetical protein GCM10018966_044490 [Streptomyces yanii]
MGEPGEFGVMGLEELMELGGSGIVDDWAHGYLSLHSNPCDARGPTVYGSRSHPRNAGGARAYQRTPEALRHGCAIHVRRNTAKT